MAGIEEMYNITYEVFTAKYLTSGAYSYCFYERHLQSWLQQNRNGFGLDRLLIGLHVASFLHS